jgi:hypothetical protein
MQIKVMYKIKCKGNIINAEFEGKTQQDCKNKENDFFKNKEYELVERRWID